MLTIFALCSVHVLGLLFFFSISPPPPRSTLFPYTTLFRSRSPHPASRRSITADSGRPRPKGTARSGRRLRATAALLNTDRKSTRLNSSHRTISYAVFCLKKKKNKHIYTP